MDELIPEYLAKINTGVITHRLVSFDKKKQINLQVMKDEEFKNYYLNNFHNYFICEMKSDNFFYFVDLDIYHKKEFSKEGVKSLIDNTLKFIDEVLYNIYNVEINKCVFIRDRLLTTEFKLGIHIYYNIVVNSNIAKSLSRYLKFKNPAYCKYLDLCVYEINTGISPYWSYRVHDSYQHYGSCNMKHNIRTNNFEITKISNMELWNFITNHY